MKRFDIDASSIRKRNKGSGMVALLQLQIDRAHEMLMTGTPLCNRLSGRFGFEIRLIVEAGFITIEKLQDNIDDPYTRPRLKRGDYPLILYRALFNRSNRHNCVPGTERQELS